MFAFRLLLTLVCAFIPLLGFAGARSEDPVTGRLRQAFLTAERPNATELLTQSRSIPSGRGLSHLDSIWSCVSRSALQGQFGQEIDWSGSKYDFHDAYLSLGIKKVGTSKSLIINTNRHGGFYSEQSLAGTKLELVSGRTIKSSKVGSIIRMTQAGALIIENTEPEASLKKGLDQYGNLVYPKGSEGIQGDGSPFGTVVSYEYCLPSDKSEKLRNFQALNSKFDRAPNQEELKAQAALVADL